MKLNRLHSILCVLLCCAVLLCACNTKEPVSNDNGGSSEVTYKVTVVNGVGEPYTEKIIVTFMQGDTKAAMIPVNAQGVAEKALTAGDYTVQITSTDSSVSFYYDTASAMLTKEKTELELVLALEAGEESITISAPSVATGESAEYTAYYVDSGTTHVAVSDGDRSYFIFVPTEAGAYELSVTDGKAELGVYGASQHFISSDSLFEAVDGKLSFSVQSSMIGSGNTGTTVYVIGLDSVDGAKDVILNVIRTGEPEWSFTEQPWANYTPANEITDYVLPEGTGLKSFDLTVASDAFELVYNEEDGCYHVNAADGPKVFAQLGESVYGICLMDMVGEIVYQDGVLMQTGSAPFRYSYNNGKDDFFKEDYTDALRQYVTCRDKESGVYPLDADLYYILTMGTKMTGWCEPGTANYRFADLEGVNNEISWMFLLVHEDTEIPALDPSQPVDPDTVTDPSQSGDSSHTHSYSKAVTAPSCTEEGHTTYTCSCGDSYTEDKTSPKGHSYGQWVTSKEPTTSATGKAQRKCANCSAVEERTLDKLIENHTHSYASKVTKAAGCTAEGVATYTCSCGSSYTESIAVLGHNYKSTVVAATCTAQGYTTFTCSRCSNSYKGSYTKATGHSYGTNGKCSRCGEKDPNAVIDDNADSPIEYGGVLEFNAEVKAGHLVHYNVYRVNGTILTISNSDAYVIYNGDIYEAKNGVVTIPKLTCADPSIPVELAIGNKGSKDAVFAVKMSYPAGAQMNPYKLSIGSLTTNVEEGNDQGVFYTYTATKSGTLTISLNSVSNNAQAGISMFNESSMKSVSTGESETTTVSVEVKAGDTVSITISTLPDSKYKYPAATIKTTVSFE